MDNTFKILFGIDSDTVQKTCVIMPFNIPKAAEQLGVKTMLKGRVFSAGQGQGLTLIVSGMSAGFVGDCVLWLKDTPCEQILFLGTCGLIHTKDDLDIGTVLTPGVIHAFESFSDILTGNVKDPEPVEADMSLIKAMKLKIPVCSCISFASLHEEERYMPMFEQLGADVIEMECSAFFLAAHRIKRPASALLVISDILGKILFSSKLSPEDKKSLTDGISQACVSIKNFCKD
jgi:purine-nucleoside phosphorylase